MSDAPKFTADPLGRAGTAEHVAEAVPFPASDASSYLTGAGLAVGGGRAAGTVPGVAR